MGLFFSLHKHSQGLALRFWLELEAWSWEGPTSSQGVRNAHRLSSEGVRAMLEGHTVLRGSGEGAGPSLV